MNFKIERQKMRNFLILYAAIVLSGFNSLHAEISYRKKPILNDPWKAESLFVGSEVTAIDSLRPVTIRIVGHRPNAGAGNLYLIHPVTDSAIFIGSNSVIDTLQKTIGSFAAETKLTFMFSVTDTSARYKLVKDKRIYTGQNRTGIDKFVSERQLTDGGYGARWALCGEIDSSTVEVGFEENWDFVFRGIVFEISNAKISP